MIRRAAATWVGRQRRSQTRAWSEGMSLLELAVALLIVGVLVAIIPPSLNGISSKWRLRGAAQDIESEVRRALNSAASAGTPVEIVYDLDGQTFRIRSGGETLDTGTLPEGVRFGRIRFSGMEIVREAAAMRAFPDGSVDAHEVDLRGVGGDFMKISFDRLTAQARFEEGTDASE